MIVAQGQPQLIWWTILPKSERLLQICLRAKGVTGRLLNVSQLVIKPRDLGSFLSFGLKDFQRSFITRLGCGIGKLTLHHVCIAEFDQDESGLNTLLAAARPGGGKLLPQLYWRRLEPAQRLRGWRWPRGIVGAAHYSGDMFIKTKDYKPSHKPGVILSGAERSRRIPSHDL